MNLMPIMSKTKSQAIEYLAYLTCLACSCRFRKISRFALDQYQ